MDSTLKSACGKAAPAGTANNPGAYRPAALATRVVARSPASRYQVLAPAMAPKHVSAEKLDAAVQSLFR